MFGDKIFRGDVWGKYPPIYWSRHISLAHKKWRGNLENANSRNANWQLVAGARRSAVTGGNLQPDARTWLAESGSRDHSARLWLVQRPGCHQATAGPRHHLISAIHNAHSPHSSTKRAQVWASWRIMFYLPFLHKDDTVKQPSYFHKASRQRFYIHKCKVQVGILQPYPEQGLSSYDKVRANWAIFKIFVVLSKFKLA